MPTKQRKRPDPSKDRRAPEDRRAFLRPTPDRRREATERGRRREDPSPERP